MRKALWLLAVLPLLMACSGKGGKALQLGGGSAVPGTLAIATIADPASLNPYLATSDIGYDLASLAYSYLVISDDRGRLIGDLVTAVPSTVNGGISADGRTYVYHLRRNVRWHDGELFTGRDVVASWRAIVDPHHSVVEREGYDRVESIGLRDPWTLVVHLRERYPPFVSRFFAPLQDGGKPVLAEHVLRRIRDFSAGELATSAVGTGPFKFESWTRGEHLTFVRNDAYFRGRPRLAKVDVQFIPSAQTAELGLATNRIDLIVEAQPALLEQYRSVPGARVRIVPLNAQVQLLFDCARPFLRDAATRRAIAHALPYPVILGSIMHGLWPQGSSMLAPTAIGYQPLPAYSFDLKKAAAELDAAGWRVGMDGIRRRGGKRLELTLATLAGATTFERMAVVIQASLRRAGIDASIKSYAYDVLIAANGPILGGTFDLSLFGNSLNWDPDAYGTYACDRWYPRGANLTRFCDKNVDMLERAGLQTDDVAARAAIYRKVMSVLWEQLPYVPINDGRRLVVTSRRFYGYRPNPTVTPWWNAWQWSV
jgi:peptide/nickel transport system substrate-binding protein